jgi:hypothetical protein
MRGQGRDPTRGLGAPYLYPRSIEPSERVTTGSSSPSPVAVPAVVSTPPSSATPPPTPNHRFKWWSEARERGVKGLSVLTTAFHWARSGGELIAAFLTPVRPDSTSSEGGTPAPPRCVPIRSYQGKGSVPYSPLQSQY